MSRGKVLELLRPDEQGKVQVIYSTEVFGVIRSLQPFRCEGPSAAPAERAQRGAWGRQRAGGGRWLSK